MRTGLTIFMMDLLATVPYYTAYLSKALLDRQVALTVGSITYYLDPICFSSRGVPLRPGLSNRVGRMKLRRLPRRILKLLETIVNMLGLSLQFLFHCPDVVHVQYLPMLCSPLPLDLWFVLFCKARGAKIVLTVHDLLPHDTANSHEPIFKRLYQAVDAIICHSSVVRERLDSEFDVSRGTIFVIPHGPFFYDLSPAALPVKAVVQDISIVLWQGILFPYKGVDLLLEAWRRVEAAGLLAELQIVGTGAPELLESLQAQAHRSGLQKVRMDFRFISTQELIDRYRAADIVVYPYRAITTSGALATGLALGKAIIASDLPVFRELLVDGENALLVAPSSPEQLADALITLLRNTEMRERLAGKVSAMNFGDASWSSIAESTVKVYEEVCSPARRAKQPCP